jgi:hypothetical protein
MIGSPATAIGGYGANGFTRSNGETGTRGAGIRRGAAAASNACALLDGQRNLRDLMREALQAELELQISFAQLEELLETPIP